MQIIIGLGTNQGDRILELNLAIEFLSSFGSVKRSPIYISPPFGFESDGDFLNMAILLNTSLKPGELLDHCLKYELDRGRDRNSKGFSDRPIDLDLLLINSKIVDNSDLKIPHPELHRRSFAIRPTADLVGDWIHPILNKSIDELAMNCEDTTPLKRYEA